MTLHAALASAATLISLAFALSTLERWLDHRARAHDARHELVWTISLLMFAAGSIGLWLGAAIGWSEATYKIFFLFGAVLNVPFLGLGTIYLLTDNRTGDRCTAAVSLLAAFAAGVVVQAPIVGLIDRQKLPQGSVVFGLGPRIAAAIGSSVPSVVIIGGALWSAGRLWRSRRVAGSPATKVTKVSPGRLAIANVLIAVGTLVAAAGGALNSLLDAMDAFAVSLVAGITIIFAGFLLTSSRTAVPTDDEWHPPPSTTADIQPSRDHDRESSADLADISAGAPRLN